MVSKVPDFEYRDRFYGHAALPCFSTRCAHTHVIHCRMHVEANDCAMHPHDACASLVRVRSLRKMLQGCMREGGTLKSHAEGHAMLRIRHLLSPVQCLPTLGTACPSSHVPFPYCVFWTKAHYCPPIYLQEHGASASSRPYCSGGIALCRGTMTAVVRYDHAVAVNSASGDVRRSRPDARGARDAGA